MIQRSEEDASSPSNAAIQAAIDALQRGDRVTARRLARQAADLAPELEMPWLILASLSGPEESMAYIQKALQINPDSPRARKALEWAQSRLPAQPPAEQPSAAQPEEPPGQARPQTGPAVEPALAPPESAAPPPGEARPSPPAQGPKKSSFSRPAKWLVGVAVVALLVVGLIFLSPRLAGLLAPPVPTPQCVQPMLTVGPSSFTIQSIARSADGTVAIPTVSTPLAYWVEGTNLNYVFGLAPSPDALALKTALKTGDPLVIHWADCGTEDYVVQAIAAGPPDTKALQEQSVPGITIFVLSYPAAEGYVVHGVRPQALQAPQTPEPTPEGATQAQVEFGESVVAKDGKTIQMSVTVTNLGNAPIAIAACDISLTPDAKPALAPLSVAPALPQQIAPGGKTTLTIVFPHPQTSTAVFRLLDFSVDMYY